MRRQGGFTLLEALIAFAVLSVGLLGLAKLTLIATQSNAEAQHVGAAVQLAQDKLAALRGFRTLAEYAALSSGSDSVTLSPVTYTRTWSLTVNSGSVDYTRATISVTWLDADGVSHSLQLSSDIGRVLPVGGAAALS